MNKGDGGKEVLMKMRYSERMQMFLDRMQNRGKYEYVPVCHGCGTVVGEEQLTSDKKYFICGKCDEREIRNAVRRMSLVGD